MPRERTQLNINIEPELLLRLKSEAIKSGMTLTQFVTSKLSDIEASSSYTILEERLAKIEEHLHLNKQTSDPERNISSIFNDKGAQEYGEVSQRLFELHLQKKSISQEDGLKELSVIINKLPRLLPISKNRGTYSPSQRIHE